MRYRKIIEIFGKISPLVAPDFNITETNDNDTIKGHFDTMRTIISDIGDLLKTLEVYDYSPEKYFRFHKLYVKIKYLNSFFKIDDNEENQVADNGNDQITAIRYKNKTQTPFYKEELRGRINVIVHDYFKEFCLEFVNFLNLKSSNNDLKTNIDHVIENDAAPAGAVNNEWRDLILNTFHLSDNDIISDLNKLNYIDHIIFKIDYN